MLPHHDLEAFHDAVVWMYVCRTWRDDEADLEAARIHDRFGVTSWPQLLLVDPASGRVLAHAPRTLPGLIDTFRQARAEVATPAAEDLARIARLDAARTSWGEGRRAQALLELRELAAAGVDPLEVGFEAAELLRAWTGEDPRTLEDRLRDPSPHERILALEALAAEGPEGDTPARRREVLARLAEAGEDPVVRLRALRWLLPRTPDAVLARAGPLLLTDSDPLRFDLLDALRDREERGLAPVLEQLVAGAGGEIPSGNPNVLRMRAIRALATSGRAQSLEVLGVHALAADPRNVTTREAVLAIGVLGQRLEGDARGRAAAILGDAWPAAVPDDTPDDVRVRATRMALALARTIASALEGVSGRSLPTVPEGWSESEREAWLASVGTALD